MFFKKEKEIIVNCYTYRSDVYNYFPIVETKKTFPSWLQKVKNSYFNSDKDCFDSVKSCPAFVDYFRTGFVIPLWSDLFLEVGPKGSDRYRWQYADLKSKIGIHPHQQFGLCETEYQPFKLCSPWAFSCSEDVQFLFSAPSWRFGDLPITVEVLNGVVSYRTNAGTNINMLVKRTEAQQEFTIKTGTPLVHVLPLTEKKVRIKTHLVSVEVWDSILGVGTRTSFVAKTKKKIQKAFTGKFKTLT
jgi:hypothetical protein